MSTQPTVRSSAATPFAASLEDNQALRLVPTEGTGAEKKAIRGLKSKSTSRSASKKSLASTGKSSAKRKTSVKAGAERKMRSGKKNSNKPELIAVVRDVASEPATSDQTLSATCEFALQPVELVEAVAPPEYSHVPESEPQAESVTVIEPMSVEALALSDPEFSLAVTTPVVSDTPEPREVTARPQPQRVPTKFPQILKSLGGRFLEIWNWAQRKLRSHQVRKRLRVCETVSLGEKRFVAVIQVDGQQFLVGGSSSSVSTLAHLERVREFSDVLQHCEQDFSQA